jgi:hypothetical protein
MTRNFTNDTNNIPPLKLNNRSAITNQEKVDLFADTLQDIFTTNPDGDANFSKVTQITVRSFQSQTPLPSLRRTNHQEIGWIIRHLKPRKAAGPDDIQNVVLKNLPMMTLKFIATIVNASIARLSENLPELLCSQNRARIIHHHLTSGRSVC